MTQISIRRHTLLFLLWRNRTGPNRETEAENTGKRERDRENDLRMKRKMKSRGGDTDLRGRDTDTKGQIDSRRHTQA